jgi:hypothetical protein
MVRSGVNKINTGSWNFGSSVIQSTGNWGVYGINTWGQSLGQVPTLGKLIYGTHIALGDYAVEHTLSKEKNVVHESNLVDSPALSTSNTTGSQKSSNESKKSSSTTHEKGSSNDNN